MENSWREAIIKVLEESAGPLHYTEITERILSRGYYKTDGATPAASVNRALTLSIKTEGETSPFIRVGRGTFALKKSLEALDEVPATAGNNETLAESDVDSSDTIIRSFGMYWQRDLVVWCNEPKIYGKQQASSRPVNFGKQIGIYILYDHHTVVYVGRSIDRPLGTRLYEHTGDRLGGRWNRFSWFGLLDVTDNANLSGRTKPGA